MVFFFGGGGGWTHLQIADTISEYPEFIYMTIVGLILHRFLSLVAGFFLEFQMLIDPTIPFVKVCYFCSLEYFSLQITTMDKFDVGQPT